MLQEKLLIVGGTASAGGRNMGLVENHQRSGFAFRLASSGHFDCCVPLISAPGLTTVPKAEFSAPPNSNLSCFYNHCFGRAWGNFSAPYARVSDFLSNARSRCLEEGHYEPGLLFDSMISDTKTPDQKIGRLEQYLNVYRPESIILELGTADVFHELAQSESEDRNFDLTLFLKHLTEIIDRCTICCSNVVVFDTPCPFDFSYYQTQESLAQIYTLDGSDSLEMKGVHVPDWVPLPKILNTRCQRNEPNKIEIFNDLDGRNISGERHSEVLSHVHKINDELGHLCRQRGVKVFPFSTFVQAVRGASDKEKNAYFNSTHFGLDGLSFSSKGHAELYRAVSQLLEVTTDEGPTVHPKTAEVIREVLIADKQDRKGYSSRKSSREFEIPIQTLYPSLDVFERQEYCVPIAGIPAGGQPNVQTSANEILMAPGQTYELELCSKSSAFGDVIRAVNSDEASKMIGIPSMGFETAQLFRSNIMTTSSLSGTITVDVSEAYETSWSPRTAKFSLSHGKGLKGQDSELSAAFLYTLPVTEAGVFDPEDQPASSGEVCLNSFRVRNFHYNAVFFNSAIDLLLEVNPKLKLPTLLFPGQPLAGHATIDFSNGAKGQLEVELAASMVLPLGKSSSGSIVRLPLPLRGPNNRPLTIFAKGTSLNPWIRLSTKPAQAENRNSEKVPQNEVRYYSLETDQSFFGDDFDLISDDLGSPALGKSPLSGQIAVQFGPNCGNLSIVKLDLLPPSGCDQTQRPPLPYLPPGSQLGLAGYDRDLHFGRTSHHQTLLGFSDDVYKPSLALLDNCKQEFFLIGLRGFISQQLFLDLLRVERAIPRDSFIYGGGGRFFGDNWSKLRLTADCRLLFPRGQRFPLPNGGATVVTENGELRPFLHLNAATKSEPFDFEFCQRDIIADDGKRLDVRVGVCTDPSLLVEFELCVSTTKYTLDNFHGIDFLKQDSCKQRSVIIAGILREISSDEISECAAHLEVGIRNDYAFVAVTLAGGQLGSHFWRGPNL